MNKIEIGTIEDLLEVLDDIRLEIPTKHSITEQEVMSRLEDRVYGIHKVVDYGFVAGLWRVV